MVQRLIERRNSMDRENATGVEYQYIVVEAVFQNRGYFNNAFNFVQSLYIISKDAHYRVDSSEADKCSKATNELVALIVGVGNSNGLDRKVADL